MLCLFCGHDETKVIDSRLSPNKEQIKRRRECEKCMERFSTLEVAQMQWPRIIKRDHRREQFFEHKLRSGLMRAFEKRSVPTEDLEAAILRLKKKLASHHEREISSELLGEWVMSELLNLDHVAYVRFASVYKRFEQIEEFNSILKSLKSKKQIEPEAI